jgi:hypothetical protein
MLHENGGVTPKYIWVKKNYMNMYILGAFEGLIKENRLKMCGMSSSKTVCLCFVTTEEYN